MMKKLFWRGITALLLSTAFIMMFMPGAYAEGDGQNDDRTTEFIVKYAEDVRTLMDENSKRNMVSKERIAEHVDLLTFSAAENAEEIQIRLESDPSIAFVEPNYKRQLGTSTNDPYYSSQWWIPHVKAQSFWAFSGSQQKKSVVAVIDSGIDLTHEDLRGKIEAGGYNFFGNNTNVTDQNGHGTSVAGVIVANSNNGIGITGVSGPFDITVLPIRVSDARGNSSVANLVRSIDYAIAQDVDVINLSLGGENYSTTENEAVQRAVRAGITVVAASGNEALKGNPINYPAAYTNVLSVGAVDQYNNRAPFSNYNHYVDLVAPGQSIYTTTLYNRYGQVHGTSFSAPIVAGAVAMMKALEPELTIAQTKQRIQQTATDLGPPGIDSYFGAGVLNMDKLAQQFKPPIQDIPVQSVQLNRDVIHFDLNDSNLKQTLIQPIQLEKLEEQRQSAAITFETEPNNSMLTSNLFPLGNRIVGSITNHYFDIDYFKFTADTDGQFSLLGSWIDSDYVSAQDNNDLAIGLYNDKQELIDYARLTASDNDQYLAHELSKGTYSLAVFQSSTYQHLFTDEHYMITTMFTPNRLPEPEANPTFLLNHAFMEVGQSEQFVLNLEKNSKIHSSNPSVATIDHKGNLHAVGHGMTRIRYTSDKNDHEAVVKVTRKTSLPTSALFETVLPKDATNQAVRWSSSNPAIAKVDEHGIITAHGVGRTKITVTTKDGGFTNQAEVIVEDFEESPDFIGDFPTMEVDHQKTFTITFNQPLIKGKDYTNDLVISRSPSGEIPVTHFKASVHPTILNQLLIVPNSRWDYGEHFMTISKELQNENHATLKQDVKMQFDVMPTNRSDLQTYETFKKAFSVNNGSIKD